MASKKKMSKAEMEELTPDFVDETGVEEPKDYDAIADELRQYVDDVEGEHEINQAADDLHEAGMKYLEAHSAKKAYPETLAEIVENAPVVYQTVNRQPKFIYNRLASVDGYNGFGVHYRKDWEIEMALKTLHDLGGAHPNANILGVGAGTERTIFELANAQSAALVTASDIYNAPAEWEHWHGKKFLQNPHKFAPEGLPYDKNRVAVMHVDMCDMPYDDEVYDGIFSSGSIEHVGDYGKIAKAAKEIGRVLKKGGIASISTEFRVKGEGWGWANVYLLSPDEIMRYIVEPSGLELVGDVDWNYYGDLEDYVVHSDIILKGASEMDKPLLRHEQFLFTSVHLALRKPS